MENTKTTSKNLTTKELEKFVLEQERGNSKSSRDSIILWSLLIVGILGIFIVLKSNNIFKNGKGEGISKTKSINPDQEIAKATLPLKSTLKADRNENMVTVHGVKEAYEMIQFDIKGYNSNADYKISFGDGIDRSLHKSSVAHAYQKPGVYPIKITATFKGETIVVYDKELTIADPIEVPDGALTEMNN